MNKAELNKKLVWGVQLNKLQDVEEALAGGADPNCCGHLCLAWAMYNSANRPKTSNAAREAAREIVILLLKHGARLDDNTFEAYYVNLVHHPHLDLLEAIKDVTPPQYFDKSLCRKCDYHVFLWDIRGMSSEEKNIINFLLENSSNPQNDNVLEVLQRAGIGVFRL